MMETIEQLEQLNTSIAGSSQAPLASAEAGWEHSILFIDDVSVSFDGFKAIKNLSLTLEPGELRCIIGPNGAGKTTMLDVITGKTRPTSGKVYMHGQNVELTSRSEYEIARLGVGRKFQRPTVFPVHSVW